MKFLALVLLILYNSALIKTIGFQSAVGRMESCIWENEDFRAMRLGAAMANQPDIDCEELAGLMLEENFDLTGRRTPFFVLQLPIKRQAEFEKLADAYHMIFDDLVCFPVPESINMETPDVAYHDGWMDKRTFGGERTHEGCDIMGDKEPSGFYPVVSMTGGTVEQAGWLLKGGWRIGIRAPSGAYFYYAHLAGYAKEWSPGEEIHAGELLGYMGDSGYGEEGTTGKFAVHLHLGIYIKAGQEEEVSVNPYWILKHMEQYRTLASY